MDKWEYKIYKMESTGFSGGIIDIEEFDRMANRYGEEGWEMVSCFDTNYSQGASRFIVAVFKRLKNV